MTPRELVKKRPTETLTGLGLAASIYGFLTQSGVSPTTAALVAVAIAFVPAAISEVVDHLRTPSWHECSHRHWEQTGDGHLRCKRCGYCEPDPFWKQPG